MTVGIAEHLDFDVPRPLHQPFDVQRPVAEEPPAPRAAPPEPPRPEPPHPRAARIPLPPPPADALTSTGNPIASAAAADAAIRLIAQACCPGHHRHARASHQRTGADLGAHPLDRLRGRTDENQSGGGAGRRKRGILGEKSVAGMDRVGAGAAGGVDHRGDVEIALRRGRRTDPDRHVGGANVPRARVGVGVDRDRLDPGSRGRRG